MLRIIALIIWGAGVALASSYAAGLWRPHVQGQPENSVSAAETSAVKIKLMSVPIVGHGAVQGYVLAQLVFTVDTPLYKQLPEPAEIFLTDEAFKTIYGEEGIDF